MRFELDADPDIFDLDYQATHSDEPTNPPSITLPTTPRLPMPTTPTGGCQFDLA